MATETTSSEEEQEYPVASSYGAPGGLGGGVGGRAHSESPMDGRAMRRSSRGSFTRASLEDLLSIDPEAYQSSVWLGTEDGWYTHTQKYTLMHIHAHTHTCTETHTEAHLHKHLLCSSQCHFLEHYELLMCCCDVLLMCYSVLQYPCVPVIGQHPQPQEQHEDAALCLYPV